MKVGGPAEFYVAVGTTEQMIKLVRWAHDADLPYFVLGGGSNILISDAGFRGLVIHNRCRAVRIDEAPCCVWPHDDDRPYLFAESGAPTAGVARTSVNAGLAGFEWAISIPGTIGGAVVGNAGAHGGEIKDSFEYGYMLDETGDVRQIHHLELAYAYRDSSLKRSRPLQAGFKPVVLSANFRLEAGRPRGHPRRADEYLQHRRRTQPTEPSLGSTFVNPPGDFAGRLIEAAGLKGAHVGGVEVSRQHANFFVNPGGVGAATARDVVCAHAPVQERVAETSGVRLVPEIQPAGEWDDPLPEFWRRCRSHHDHIEPSARRRPLWRAQQRARSLLEFGAQRHGRAAPGRPRGHPHGHLARGALAHQRRPHGAPDGRQRLHDAEHSTRDEWDQRGAHRRNLGAAAPRRPGRARGFGRRHLPGTARPLWRGRHGAGAAGDGQHVPYVGCGVLSSAVSMDKVVGQTPLCRRGPAAGRVPRRHAHTLARVTASRCWTTWSRNWATRSSSSPPTWAAAWASAKAADRA